MTATGGRSQKNRALWIGAGATIVAALIPVFFTVILPKLTSGASQSIFPLNRSYSGTATSTTSGVPNGLVTFTLDSEDQQGDVKLLASFFVYDTGNLVHFSCNGQVTANKMITLNCKEIEAPDYMVEINGSISPDGQIDGTWTTTEESKHFYHHYTLNLR